MDEFTRNVIEQAKDRLDLGVDKQQVYEEAKAMFRQGWLDHWEYSEAVKALADAIEL